MTAATGIYSEAGIRTKEGAYWLLAALLVAALNAIVLYVVRTNGPHLGRTLVVLVWVLAVAFGTLRALGRLAALETGEPPDEARKLAFQLALIQPILGLTPVILLLLP